MCGGSKPEKPKPTQSEIKQQEIAARDLKHFEQNYLPLEFDAIADASPAGRDREAEILKGRANADVAAEAQAATAANRVSLRNGTTQFVADSGDTQNAIGAAQSRAAQGAAQVADQRFKEKNLQVIKTGRDMARTVHSGLSSAADAEVTREKASLRSRAIKNAAKMQAFTDLASAGITAGAVASLRPKKPVADAGGNYAEQRYQSVYGTGYSPNQLPA